MPSEEFDEFAGLPNRNKESAVRMMHQESLPNHYKRCLPHRSFARPMAGGEVLDINLLPRHEMARKVVLLESFVHALVERRIHRRHHQPVTAGTATADQAGVSACVRRSEEHTSELQSLMRISYAAFCLKNKNRKRNSTSSTQHN